MNVVLLLACHVLLAQTGMFAKIVPNPTGRNGYEEYVRAAEYVYTPDFSAYSVWLFSVPNSGVTPDTVIPPDVSPRDSDLVVREKWTNRYRVCTELIRTGNNKPVYDPRGGFTPETTFPEMAAFRTLTRLECATAHVEFARGLTGSALQHLEDSVVFGGRIGGAILIGRLVGIACDSLALNELNDHWAQLSVSDAAQASAFFRSRIGGPPPVAETLQGEKSAGRQLVDRMFSKPEQLADMLGEESGVGDLSRALKKLSPEAIQALQTEANRQLDAYYDSIAAVLQGPESGWIRFAEPPDASKTDETSSGLAKRLAEVIRPSMSRVLVREAQDRTLMRLAYLTARAIEYRWHMGRLPRSIEAYTTPSERLDPTSGRAFVLKREGQWFRIVREGKDALGEVGMYKPPAAVDPNSLPSRP